MMTKLAEWASGHRQLTKLWLSECCKAGTVPLDVGQWYNFHEAGCHLGNVGQNLIPWLEELHNEDRITVRGLYKDIIVDSDRSQTISVVIWEGGSG